MKLLLLQARNLDDTARIEEVKSFAEKANITEEQIVTHNLVESPPDIEAIKDCDALLIGGSGDYYVSKRNLPYFHALLDVLAKVVEIGHPTFASCFGFQLLVQALDGEIIHDPVKMQVGTYPLTLTGAGKQDSLLGELPTDFKAQLGRKDRATRLPSNAIHLATSENCPYQALRIIDKPIWATQFHPELSGAENKKRFQQYIEGYGSHMLEEEKQSVLNSFSDSPETHKLLPRFLELVKRYK